jgi:myo-inositol-1(or 4)-monophosphatase
MPSPPPDAEDHPRPATLRLIAEAAARAGGQAAQRCFGRAVNARLKKDGSEVCEADEAAQAAVIASIGAQRSADAFVTEETLPQQDARPLPPPAAPDQVTWVIDPLDGTRNFLRGIPLYACSVAAMRDGLPVCGAIYDPVRDVLYSASRDDSLLVNGQPCPLDRPLSLNPKPVLAIPSSPKGHSAVIAHQWLDRYVCRSLGSTALELAWVASGGLDAALFDNARLWDIAAGWVLVISSGGRMTAPHGEPLFPLDVQRYANEKLPCLAARDTLYEQLVSAPADG